MDSNLGDTVASTLQPRNRLENRKSENDEMLRGVWKAVETSTGEVSIGETKEVRSKKRSGKEAGEKNKKNKQKKEKQ